MDFMFSQEQLELKDEFRNFVDNEIIPCATDNI